MMAVDETRHDDGVGRIDLDGVAISEIRPDGSDVIALDEHVS